ncbi:hypothetical protein EOK75_20605 (plasmid) [Pseudorhodobacter turbinis]|uniref:Uncharacterized protein n=1 Tax=Pseudorhodobacter turbinis TaxID=2500533 RepID=A0A4P8ELI7_9RHOB|nr:hypothetical protein [Pseudorhodobacter turbinis]QCO58160.1 hypothetical protein EOK75_20605 [Pseudorhodobacter turbinis]
MFDRIKKMYVGKVIYRIARLPVIGVPVLILSRFVQYEIFQIVHLLPSNIAHNKRARTALEEFEAKLK